MYVERITWRVALVVLAIYAVIALTIATAAPGRVIDYEELNTTHLRFAGSYNDWQTEVLVYSNVSPNVSDKVREAWLRYEVGENFRRLERALAGE